MTTKYVCRTSLCFYETTTTTKIGLHSKQATRNFAIAYLPGNTALHQKGQKSGARWKRNPQWRQ